ncbi:aldose epimerase family protein [Mucilaginibacter myungsuensis]|uniref:Aldose 1-epimerase n=1 Tax=Mucilaginibacter myungsuensis TaxID=649104 RepID=A0A929L138_9SPHI|nr:aldose epimerase family protein [Mucilaginibacter myungsuensis]MBE9664292.1 galactose mutarotase [Mucilaginibacter myungsuensis]MDN3599996.1 aldose epimerase family protein [Mucilaginibacter myungsuensis]
MEAQILTLENEHLQVNLTNYGARITGLITKDKAGNPVDVVAGFATVDDNLNAKAPYYGATIGRFANRIAKGQFTLNGEQYQLPINNGENALHGGSGFNNKVWDIIDSDEQYAVMQHHSEDMEDGYPGDMKVVVVFTIDGATLRIDYEATTNKDTIINLTNHAFFNLNGEGEGDILGHSMQINADRFTPITGNLIPTGELASLDGSVFDFRSAKAIGQDINADDEQLRFGQGYDHNYVLNKTSEDELSFAAKAIGDITGISVEVFTTEPGMQLYTGNFMDGQNTFKGGAKDIRRTCFCLETQHFPDSPNQPDFPSTVLKHGDEFRSTTEYRFGVA